MSRTKKKQKLARESTAAHAPSQKVDRESTAAYAASQPLFDALRNGAANVDVQRDNLAKARDVVQQVHVKIVTEDAPSHEQYMENIVEAWKSATEVYCEVFQQLTSITAAEPSEGREAGKEHEQFMDMLDAAQKARDAAKAYAPGSASAASAGKAATVESDDEGEEEATSVKPKTKTTTTALSIGKAKRSFSELNVEALPPTPATNGHKQARSDRRKSWKIATEATDNMVEPKSQRNIKEPAPPESAAEATSKPESAVKYEDVSHEVEARLKAKAEKAAEKKKSKLNKEMKRKRESGDSFVAVAEEKTHEPVQTEAKVEKPKRKKAKSAGAGVEDTSKHTDKAKEKKPAATKADVKQENHVPPKEKPEKRKTDVEQVEEGEKPAGKKRKKNKGF